MRKRITLICMETCTLNNYSRRWILAAGAAFPVISLAGPALALTSAEAEALINRMLVELNRIINSGRSAAQMFGDFERLFAKYADVPTIALTVLGPPARSASTAQKRAYTAAFRGYMARKYGRRFREVIGGRLEVRKARRVRSRYEVDTTALLRGEPPFDVTFVVLDRSNKFVDMRIEGISLLKIEKDEVGAMLDRRRGNLDAMIQDLQRAG